jgi:uncharacterized protein (TIGR03435 family)
MKHTILRSILIASAGMPAFAQATAAPPGFEVASVKPSDPAGTLAIRRSGNRIFFSNTSLLFLITWAYDVHSDHVYNQPKWLDSVRFDIMANAPEDETPAAPRLPGQPSELQRMMQALLADRFKLAVHKEEKELPVYALVVAKGGARVQLREAPKEFGQNPFRMPGAGLLVGTEVNAEMLAKVLSGQLSRTVEDHTGLKGVFDFKLEWQPDSTTAPAEAGAGPSIFTALQEQLGLRLEGRKGRLEVLVIDHIENAPTEN